MNPEETVIREWVAAMTRESGAPLPPSQRRAEPLPRRRVLPVVQTLLDIIDDERAHAVKVLAIVEASQRLNAARLVRNPEPTSSVWMSPEQETELAAALDAWSSALDDIEEKP